MLDGIIEQSKSLLAASTNGKRKSRPPPVVKPAIPQDRRHFSQSQAGATINPSFGTRLSSGTLGLGQKEYSATLGLLSRSQSVKHTSFSTGRRTSMGPFRNIPSPPEQENMQPVVDEENEFEEVEAYSESDEDGSVVRFPADEVEDKEYPGLSLDFGSGAESGVSAMA